MASTTSVRLPGMARFMARPTPSCLPHSNARASATRDPGEPEGLAEAAQRSGLRSKQQNDITKRRGEKSRGVRRDLRRYNVRIGIRIIVNAQLRRRERGQRCLNELLNS